MRTNSVWSLVNLPANRRAIGAKWVLKLKLTADGEVERYKARLVAKGYTQIQGVDFDETYSPTVRYTTVRAILALVACLNLELHQMDVKTAFLHGNLEEEIYMEQPEGFITPGKEHKVCKLQRSIYGLKQSSRQWYRRFHEEIVGNGFVNLHEDPCVYTKTSGSKYVIITLYVDDILLAANDVSFMNESKSWLASAFEMKDMGEATYILGIKIVRDRAARRLCLSQESYINKLLKRFRMLDAKPMDTPVAFGCSLSKHDGPKNQQERKQMKNVEYLSMVGSLMYAMLCTRPDICYAVGLVARFQSDPGPQHLKAVKRIIRYLKGTADYVLCYEGRKIELTGYSDADHGGDPDDRKSTSGGVFLLANAAISWASKKQSCVALSTMESEFVALSKNAQEAVWLKRLLNALIGTDKESKPVKVYSDSQAAIAAVKNPKYHSRTKHIDVKYNYAKSVLEDNIIALEYLPTDNMVADPLTKPLRREIFEKHVKLLGLRRA